MLDPSTGDDIPTAVAVDHSSVKIHRVGRVDDLASVGDTFHYWGELPLVQCGLWDFQWILPSALPIINECVSSAFGPCVPPHKVHK